MLKVYALSIKEDKLELRSIDADKLSKAFLAGAKNLQNNEDRINELNVFPVPDGDTGTNMTMTAISAAKAILELEKVDFKSVGKAMSSGSLRGARGNSGVILSQLLRGFSKVIKKEEIIDVKVLALASENATETAYKAVMKPTEGTILTVARKISEKAVEIKDNVDDILEFLEIIIEEGDKALQSTPELLPVLKQAGVVDSGGSGLMALLKGVLSYLKGEDVDLSFDNEDKENKGNKEHTYKLSFVLKVEDGTALKRIETFKEYIYSVSSNVEISDREEDGHIGVEVSANTDVPGEIIKKACILGKMYDISFKNLFDKEEKENEGRDACKLSFSEEEISNNGKENCGINEKASSKKKEFGFVSVSAGEGINEIFLNMGVDKNITGGQTMNPSTEDILKAVEAVNADTVFVLPNNKNIILAANQAVSLEKSKNIVVIPTKTIPQGIAALINFDSEKSVEENIEVMNEEIHNVKTGQVTYAVRDTEIDGKVIRSGDFMGISDKGIVSVGINKKDVLVEMLETLVSDEDSLITLYYGEGVTESEAEEIKEGLSTKFSNLDIDIENGGQPVYSYIVSVE